MIKIFAVMFLTLTTLINANINDDFINECKKKRPVYEVLKLYLTQGAMINATDEYEKSALIYAVNNNNEKLVFFLLAVKGIDPNIKDYDGNTPLMIALENNYSEIVQLLLGNTTIDLQAVNDDDKNLLKLFYEYAETDDFLLKYIDKITISNQYNYDLTFLLLNKGFYLSADRIVTKYAGKYDNYTLLRNCINNDNQDFYKRLLSIIKDFDINHLDENNYTLLNHAIQSENQFFITDIESRGGQVSKITVSESNDETPVYTLNNNYWNYSKSQNPLTDEITHTYSTIETDSYKPAYTDEYKKLVIRISNNGVEVLITWPQTLIWTDTFNPYVTVTCRFDQNDAYEFSCNPSTNRNATFIKEYDINTFINNIIKSKKLLLLYVHNGDKKYGEFLLSGLQEELSKNGHLKEFYSGQ